MVRQRVAGGGVAELLSLKSITYLVAVTILCVVGVSESATQRIAEFTYPDLDGNTHKLSDYRGKVILLDFWGDW